MAEPIVTTDAGPCTHREARGVRSGPRGRVTRLWLQLLTTPVPGHRLLARNPLFDPPKDAQLNLKPPNSPIDVFDTPPNGAKLGVHPRGE